MLKRAVVAAAVAFLAMIGYANAQPCPVGSQERAFEMRRDLTRCVFGAVEGNSVGARYGRYYNVYCPGRMSMSQAVNVANALSRNSPPVPGNPIPADFARLGLAPRYAFPTAATSGVADDLRGVHHWFHYNCGAGGVATHVKVEIADKDPSSRQVARYCSEVNRAGSVRRGGRVDIEYRCAIHLKPSDRFNSRILNCPDCRPPSLQEVAALKVQAGIVPAARAAGLRTCLLDSTDIQCAPCSSSDKLVVRMAFVSGGARCPGGTTRILP